MFPRRSAAVPGWVTKALILLLAVAIAVAGHRAFEQQTRSADPGFLLGAVVEPAVRNVLLRSCADCHSESTQYPWYSYVPGVSQLIQDDVRRGREQLNFSKWNGYSRLRRQRALTGIANQVRDRIMPLPEYLRLHPSARLSDADVDAVFAWAEKERLRLIMQGLAIE